MNKVQKLLEKINDEKQKIEREFTCLCNLQRALYYSCEGIKKLPFSTKYGKQTLRLYEKTFEKMQLIINAFEQEYAPLIDVTAEGTNEQGGDSNE